jgi:hypothetical protein
VTRWTLRDNPAGPCFAPRDLQLVCLGVTVEHRERQGFVGGRKRLHAEPQEDDLSRADAKEHRVDVCKRRFRLGEPPWWLWCVRPGRCRERSGYTAACAVSASCCDGRNPTRTSDESALIRFAFVRMRARRNRRSRCCLGRGPGRRCGKASVSTSPRASEGTVISSGRMVEHPFRITCPV